MANEGEKRTLSAEKVDHAKAQHEFDCWWYAHHQICWLKTLCDCYETEHDYSSDEDPSATNEMINEVMYIYHKLLAELGDAPPRPAPPERDPTIPF